MTAVFLFHRDLRVDDNTTLLRMLKECGRVVPVFVFDNAQIDRKRNAYFSNAAVQFMCESLADLDEQIVARGSRLHLFKGDTLRVLKAIHAAHPLKSIGWNKDWSAFAKERDAKIAQWAQSAGIQVYTDEDYYLTTEDQGLIEPDGKPYKVLAAFWRWFLKNHTVPQPTRAPAAGGRPCFEKLSIPALSTAELHQFYEPIELLAMHGGRKLGQERLKAFVAARLPRYAHDRNVPSVAGTSGLSPYLKFGCVSIREAYWAIRKASSADHPFLRELVFRDFYAKIYAMDAALQRYPQKALAADLDRELHWLQPTATAHAKALWTAWTTGTTGFPLVDAGMRELLATGHQHNRVRMLCASVLTKYFWIDWRDGAKFYYTHLVDADVFSNTAGWGFSSSTGPDAVPYFRAPFNPFIQSKKFDTDAAYIKQWVPELRDVAAKDIHRWYEPKVRAAAHTAAHTVAHTVAHTEYPDPVVDHTTASHEAVAAFKSAAKRVKK